MEHTIEGTRKAGYTAKIGNDTIANGAGPMRFQTKAEAGKAAKKSAKREVVRWPQFRVEVDSAEWIDTTEALSISTTHDEDDGYYHTVYLTKWGTYVLTTTEVTRTNGVRAKRGLKISPAMAHHLINIDGHFRLAGEL